ncbi:MAG TPA: ATP-binding protein [Rheinheimera sp.]|nr:ATP-binding protein [Rheinheimera sp.]
MNSALLRFYFAIVLLVLLLFFSLNQLYSLMYQRNDIVVAAQSILQQAYLYQQDPALRLSCRISDTEDCADSLFVTYPQDMWQPIQGFDYQLEIMRDSEGNASLCAAMPSAELLCMSKLNLPVSLDFSVDLVHVFILLLLLFLFWLSRNVFRDVETLRQSALKEVALGRLPAFQLSKQSYLQPLAQSLSRMNQTIADLNTLQREMADTVCHDIKTPLARLRFILLRLENQLPDSDSSQIRRNLQEIEDNVYDYLRLAQKGFRSELQLSQIDPAELLAELIDKFAANSEHILILRPAPAFSIQADKKLLQRALSNLLSNALRYCHGHVWVELQLADNCCLIDIIDDGAGWNSAEAVSDGVSHHGIGLAIVARVAMQHGGNFSRFDRPEGGAVARLSLPVGSTG